MDLATTDHITGKELEPLGLVQGNIVLATTIGKSFMASLKLFTGGEMQQYTELLKEARATATERMVQEAQTLGADAVVMVRYVTSQIVDPAAEVMVYGTAVRYKK
ncbi:MAG: YbjQ family protein [Firmicutes bacterium]|nr:YbjQ family protein [Bacillota bacterium]